MRQIKKFSLPASILTGCIILGGFYYASEANKQASIEKQQQIDLQTKQAEQQAITDKNNLVASQTAQNALILENSRISKAEQCIKKAEATAVSDFYIECINNPAVGGSAEKCSITDDPAATIQYIRSEKAISFGVFEIDDRLTKDEAICTTLYGK